VLHTICNKCAPPQHLHELPPDKQAIRALSAGQLLKAQERAAKAQANANHRRTQAVLRARQRERISAWNDALLDELRADLAWAERRYGELSRQAEYSGIDPNLGNPYPKAEGTDQDKDRFSRHPRQRSAAMRFNFHQAHTGLPFLRAYIQTLNSVLDHVRRHIAPAGVNLRRARLTESAVNNIPVKPTPQEATLTYWIEHLHTTPNQPHSTQELLRLYADWVLPGDVRHRTPLIVKERHAAQTTNKEHSS
jgi:hypothetical protein